MIIPETLEEWLENQMDYHAAKTEILKRILKKMKGGKNDTKNN